VNPTHVSRRRLIGALGLGAAGIAAGPVLAGCGSNSGGVQKGGGGGSSKATLSQWYHQYGEKGTEQAAKKYAADYKDANVNVSWTLGDYASKLASRLVSGSGVDVFEDQTSAVSNVRAGRYDDLTDIMDPVKGSFSEAALKRVTVDGKIYGIPMIIDPQFIYYRKSLLDKAGIKAPQSMDDLVSATKELTGGGKHGAFWGNDGGVVALSMPAIWAGGGDGLTADNSKAAFATDGTAKAAAALRQMYADKSILLGAPTDWTDPGAFNGGLVAMQWCGLWAMPTITAKWGDDVGIMPMPPGAGKPTVLLGGWNQFVAGKASDVDAAKKFVKSLWIDNTEAQTDWSLSYGFHIPPRQQVASKADKLKSGLPAEALTMFTDHARALPPYWTPEMNTDLADAMTRILQNGGDPAQQLDAAAQKVTAAAAKLAA